MISEFAYEELLRPERLGPPAEGGPAGGGLGRGTPGQFVIDTGAARYTFTARRGTFGTYWLDPASLARDGAPAHDPAQFAIDARGLLGWSGDTLADVLRELAATQRADALLAERTPPAAELADLGFAELEGYTTGHPAIVANKGRLGFAATDAARYTPEAARPFRLAWVAAHPELVRRAGLAAAGPPPGRLLRAELDPGTLAGFAAATGRRVGELAPVGPRSGEPARAADYALLPLHPWQLDHVLRPLWAAELATGLLVDLGEGGDRYRPLASVRTLANVDHPDRHDVKLALMIRNTLVWRGLSEADVVAGPAVSDWLTGLAERDPFLAEHAIRPLAEVGGVALAQPWFDAVADAPYRFHELVAALWREPVAAGLGQGERARSLAALLLVGSDGRSLAAELVARSGRGARAWLAALVDALLPPLLHYLIGYGVAFTPHGENVIVIFGPDELPRRVAVKDFGADIELVAGEFPEREPLPAAAAAHCRVWPAPLLAHSILSALVAGHFRVLSVLADDQLGLPEAGFWRLVRAAVDRYRARFPHYAGRIADAGLLAPRFGRVCLNREQLAGAGFHDRAERDAGFDVLHGTVANPLTHPLVAPTVAPEGGR
ncbi:MAG: IucA/IucC family protein [Frankia sp.]|nr:IucA/IucC family protein [Frankia sp.]